MTENPYIGDKFILFEGIRHQIIAIDGLYLWIREFGTENKGFSINSTHNYLSKYIPKTYKITISAEMGGYLMWLHWNVRGNSRISDKLWSELCDGGVKKLERNSSIFENYEIIAK